MSNLPTIPTPEGHRSGSDLLILLDDFDPERHGGEVMAFAPAEREFGNPDYEKPAMSLGDPDAI
jgi:hypothetical protein